MPLSAAAIVLAALLAATLSLGLVLLWRQRRPRHPGADESVEPRRLGAAALGERATLLQFSSEMSARCPTVHRTLAAISKEHDGVLHLDVDLTGRPDIAKRFHVLQTPTTLILDRNGHIQTRFGGTASRDAVELELARVTAHAPRM